MTVYVSNATRKAGIDTPALKRDVRRLLAAVGEAGASVSLSFVRDPAIRELNRTHRGKDKATDVLSFGLLGAPPGPAAMFAEAPSPEGAPERLLGDIVISVDAARRQAQDYDATMGAEVRRLVIHGILHLLGHDHERARERARMEREERRLAAAIGLPWPY